MKLAIFKDFLKIKLNLSILTIIFFKKSKSHPEIRFISLKVIILNIFYQEMMILRGVLNFGQIRGLNATHPCEISQLYTVNWLCLLCNYAMVFR